MQQKMWRLAAIRQQSSGSVFSWNYCSDRWALTGKPTSIDKVVTAERPSQEGLLGGRSSDCRSQQQWNHVDETQHPGAKPQHPGNELTDQRNPTEQ